MMLRSPQRRESRKGLLWVLFAALLWAGSVAGCDENEPDRDELVAEYLSLYEAALANPFSATYAIRGGLGVPLADGELTWSYHPEKGQRFDIHTQEVDGTPFRYTLIETPGGRIVCDLVESNCSDYVTALQGSDYNAIALLLPVGDEWWFETPRATEFSAVTHSVKVKDEQPGRCFTFKEEEDDVSVEFKECFRTEAFAVRRAAGVVAGESSELDWQLTNITRVVPESFLDPPFPVKHGGEESRP